MTASASALQELRALLEAHPGTRFFDAYLNDLNTVERGKRIDRAGIEKIYAQGMPLPGSMFALDVRGGTIQATGYGFDEGDADRPCFPIPGSLHPVPWNADGVAQLQLTMHEHDGRAFFGDPRHVLARVLERYSRLNLTPVVAIEYEFYFVDLERTPEGFPQPPRGPLTGRREHRTQINSMADLNEYSGLLSAIDSACRAQGVPATTALAEYGPGQYEVNLLHRADALRACDEALRLKRVVKSIARVHGCEATFLPKPYRDMAGSGLHVHVSLLDAAGHNLFACDDPLANATLRHAIAGVLATLGEGTAICAPGPNSYRRLRPESYVPTSPSWAVNNRGTAVRIPASDPANRRIEHRLAGADANPYLVTAWALAGVLQGIAEGREPPLPLTGNAYRAKPSGIPLDWATAIRAFEASPLAQEYFGRPFTELYATVKRGELEEFSSYATPLEFEWYLGPL